jgi:molybdopterin-binding protein
VVTTFRIGQAAAVLGVSPDTVRRWVDAGRLPARRSEGGHRLIEGSDLAELVRTTGDAHVPESASAQSARNRFTGIVTRVVRDRVAAQVEVQAGPHRIVSLMTAEAVGELHLRPGVLVVAVVKATNVVIDVPAQP